MKTQFFHTTCFPIPQTNAVDGNTLVFIKIFFFLYFRLLFNGNRACASNSMSTKYPSFSPNIYTPRVYAEVRWVQKQIFKFQTNDVQVAQTTKGGTGSLVNGHNCTMQLFFFFTFQYFQKKLAIVLDVPIHNLSRQKKSKIHGLGVVFIEENLFYWTFWNKTLHVV